MSPSEQILKTVAPTSVWLPTSSTKQSSPPTALKLKSQSKVSTHFVGKNPSGHVFVNSSWFVFLTADQQNNITLLTLLSEFVSTPDISFTVLKEEPQNYFAIVVCNSTRGDLPITYSLYRGKEQVFNMTVEKRHSVFKLPLVMDRHLGFFRCHASNGEQTTYSQWLPLHVGMFLKLLRNY